MPTTSTVALGNPGKIFGPSSQKYTEVPILPTQLSLLHALFFLAASFPFPAFPSLQATRQPENLQQPGQSFLPEEIGWAAICRKKKAQPQFAFGYCWFDHERI